MPGPDKFRLHFLLEDYSESLAARASTAHGAALGPSDHPLYLRVVEFERRIAWQRTHGAENPHRLRADGPAPEFLAERFDPRRRYDDAGGSGVWPPDAGTDLHLQVAWERRGLRSRGALTKAAAVVLHLVGLVLLVVPGTMQLDLNEPADWNTVQITLMTPSLDDLPPLENQVDIAGEGQDGFRGLPAPAPDPGPGPEAEPENPPEPEPEEVAEVAQPVEVEEPDPEPEDPALEEKQEPPEPEPPPAQSPDPGEFRRGVELAQVRDPRLLPMPAAPARKRAVLKLENPPARMPSRQGSAQLGTLELTPRPGEVISGAIEQMKRSGPPRQAVGDGIGGSNSRVMLPNSPAESGSIVELLSDPRGVDFRPYLTQVLAAVRRNWFAVIPESARLGMSRGRTLIQFSVARNGSVPKLVIAKSSGAPPLDRAAVAGVSASNPFPPLPREYIGGDIRLQFTFLYNIRNP
ncbi:MAG: TonB C-terminal domain-containing protein [Acidobacteriia bacterium]|nr:TonB C-terminal domain-containing protein [Terriglobia bacterium]